MRKQLFTSLAFLSLVITGCNETQHSHTYEVNGDAAWTWVAGEDVTWKSASVTFTCSGCDESAQGHSFTLGVSVTSEITLAPTCEASGTKVYTASVEFEGKTYTNTKEETLPAIGHKALEGWSCDQNSHWHGCEHEMCQSKLDEASHSLKAIWSSDDSKHWHECEVCDYKADLADHVFNQNIQTKDTLMKAADCTHDAVFFKSCTCGAISKTETFVAEGTAIGHEMTKHDAVAPTCEKAGSLEYFTCSHELGVYYKDANGSERFASENDIVVDAIGHEASEEWSHDSNKHWHACDHEDCKAHFDEETHTFNQNFQTNDALKTAADCLNDAVYYKSCICGEISKTETFVAEGTALGHDMSKHDAVAPTCEKNGNLEYYTCSREPGVYYKDENGANTFNDITEIVVGALGHKASEDWSYDSTNHWHACEHENCDEHIDEEAHNLKESWSLDESQHWHECEVCGYKTDIANHTFDQKVKNDKTLKSVADCTHDAVYYKSCVCGAISKTETFVDEGTALGHDMTKHNCVPPKYNANGIKEYYTCSHEPGYYFTDEEGTDIYDEEELVILPTDWMFGPGDEFGFNWTFDKGYDEYTPNLPFTLTTEYFSYVDNYIVATLPDNLEEDSMHNINIEMKPFFPNFVYGEQGEYVGYVGDEPCMLKVSTIILHMVYQVWQYVDGCFVNYDLMYDFQDAYNFTDQSYTIDVSQFTEDCDYSDFVLHFSLSNHHASEFPEIGTELKTFGVELVGELVAYDGPMPPEEEFETPYH